MAAVQGLANAQNGIGVIFKQGTSSSPQDYSMAVKWFREAAEQGNSRGELRIGVAYYYGEGVEHDYEQDYEQAIEWLKKASEQGNGMAAALVGTVFELGRGVEVKHE